MQADDEEHVSSCYLLTVGKRICRTSVVSVLSPLTGLELSSYM